jgi:formylglycine-generating enzyme required for sulfatase activity
MGDSFIDPGATAIDDADGNITSDIVVTGSVNTALAGTYTLTYSVTDSDNNTASITRTVVVSSPNAPTITLIGLSVFNINMGDSFIDPGATAIDDADGNITSDIVVTGSVNTALAGTYTLTYNVSDSEGNAAFPINRSIVVNDNAPPTTTASPLGNTYTETQTVTLTADEASTIYYTVDGSTPTTGSSVYNSGISIETDTTLKFFAVDGVDNTEAVQTQSYVIDTTVPTTTASPLGNTYNETQTVTLTADESGTIYYTTDGATPNESSIVYSGPISIDNITTLKFFAIDSLGNVEPVNTEIYTFNSTDETIPIISLSGASTINLTTGDTYTEPGTTATDDVDGDISGNISISGSVDTSTEGTYTLTYSVSDSSSNAAIEVTRTVIVSTGVGVDLNIGLIAHYKFDGNANDSSGNGSHGTENGGISYTTGFDGQSASFDGIDDHIFIPTSNHPTGEVSITYSAWIRKNGDFGSIVGVGDKLVNKRSDMLIETNNIQYVGESNDASVNTSEILAGVWTHIVITKQSQSLNFYVNGSLIGQRNTVDGQNITNTNIFIGSNPGGAENYTGDIDEVRIYNRALSQSEVQQLADSTLQSGLVAHYEFEGNATDSSGNASHGSEVGGVTYLDGFMGQAAHFDGIDDYVFIPTSNHPTGEVSITYSAWIRIESVFGVVVGAGDPLSNKRSDMLIQMNQIDYERGGDSVSAVTAEVLVGVWTHIAITKQSQAVKVYANGILVGQGDTTEGQNITNTNIFIGSNPGGAENYTGDIDEVRIYNRALSQSEVQQLASPTYTNSLGMSFKLLPAGTFTMGSPVGELGRDGGADETEHQVTLTESYYMQTTEVTQGQWLAVMGTSPSNFSSCGSDCPVEQVSWDDIQLFLTTINSLGEGTYSLPTEAQWEYACRAGTTTAFANGEITSIAGVDPNLELMGWYDRNSGSTTHLVAQKAPNALGLYDMHGNAWEWTADWYSSYSGDETDPTGPASGSIRVGRGGSWGLSAQYTRCAGRGFTSPDDSYGYIGFRLHRTPSANSTLYAIGDTGPAGGIVFYVTDGGLHGLEAAAVDQVSTQWGCYGTTILGANGTVVGTGEQNTADIIAGCNETTAASVASAHGPGWYLPSKDELNELYLNRSDVDGVASDNYWSSSQYVSNSAWYQRFGSGDPLVNVKTSALRVRAVRAF